MGAAPSCKPPPGDCLSLVLSRASCLRARLPLDSRVTQSQSQSYFTTRGLPQNISSWRQALKTHDQYFFNWILTVTVFSIERMGLSFTIAAGPRQRSCSRVHALQDSWPYFTVSNSRLPQPGGLGPRIYIVQEQGDPVIHPSTGCCVSILQIYSLHGPTENTHFSQFLYCCVT
jgi:hypothetical protein